MNKKKILHLIIGLILLVSSAYAKTNSQEEELNSLDIISSDLIDNGSEYKLVFFGYAGCYHFCDPRLRQIDPIYKELKKELDIKMLFVDISKETTLDDAELFVQEVNSEFEAINPDNENIKILQKKFADVYIRKMPDGEYLHSGFLYLLKKYKQNYYLVKIYPEFDNTNAIINDIRDIIKK